MRIVYAGSSEYAIPALEELMARRSHQIALVVSQPARPQGRKLRAEDPPLATAARMLGLEVFSPEDINAAEAIQKLGQSGADIIITASYGAFLGRSLRGYGKYGAINLHPSLLPKYRGPSPIRAALLASEKITGTSIFRLVRKMDAGPILMQESLEITLNENYGSLHDRLANQAALLLPQVLDEIESLPGIAQDEAAASYSKMLDKADLRLDFSQDSSSLIQKIKAYAPQPGAYTVFRGKELKILEAEQSIGPGHQVPGTIHQTFRNIGFIVATGDGEILVRKVQAAGKKAMDAWTYSLGARFQPRERIDI